ncbi:unnamed protein product [Cladocopium goreaui]|uniref:Uncharacterized protein n=1 Tax=Cladocopium goreaui TaxID=2562237 RepID=A0A9P1BVV7_9DINO|nr:unnamed protein product [Cladocopium goreaui]
MSGKDFERLFQDFEARTEYLKCSHAAASSASGSRVELSQKVIDQFVAGLGGMSLNASRAQRLFTLISGSPFDEGKQLTTAIDEAVNRGLSDDTPSQTPRNTDKSVQHAFFQHYLTEKDWETLQAPGMDVNTKIRVLVKRCQALRMRHICEDTARRICCVLTLSGDSRMCAAQVDPFEFYGLLGDFKVMLRFAWKNSSVEPVTLKSFPADPTKLKPDLFSSAYHRDEPPVRSKLDEGILLEMVSTLPARNTHGTLKGGCASGSKNQATMTLNKLNSFLQRLEGFGGQDYRARRGSTRIKMLKGHDEEEFEEQHPTRRRKPEPLQIEYTPREGSSTPAEPPVPSQKTTEPAPAMPDMPDEKSKSKKGEEATKKASICDMASSMLKVLGEEGLSKDLELPKKGSQPKSKSLPKPKSKTGLKITKCSAATKPKPQPTISCSKNKPPGFPGTKRQPPIRWGSCTIYTSDTKWRVKLNAGDRLDVPKPFTDQPKKGWQEVIKLCKERGTFEK